MEQHSTHVELQAVGGRLLARFASGFNVRRRWCRRFRQKCPILIPAPQVEQLLGSIQTSDAAAVEGALAARVRSDSVRFQRRESNSNGPGTSMLTTEQRSATADSGLNLVAMTQAVDDADHQVWCGIDLGTTMTKFALMFAGDAEPSLRPFEHGGKKMESIVFVHRDETQWSCPGEMNIDHMVRRSKCACVNRKSHLGAARTHDSAQKELAATNKVMLFDAKRFIGRTYVSAPCQHPAPPV
jgi:hypothetical protein